MIVLPSDHQIKMPEVFRDTLESASEVAEHEDNIVTIGITPNYPETGYGYIKYLSDQKFNASYKVERFVEKPDLETAIKYVSSNQYLWNAGQFIWKVSTILKDIKKYMPDTYEKLLHIKDTVGKPEYEAVLKDEFTAMESQSIDYGVLEKADEIYTIPGSFGWDDVGSWLAIERLQEADNEGNVVAGNVITVNTTNCIIQGNEKLIAAVGLEGIVIVNTNDAVLISTKEHCGEIKQVMKQLEESGRDNLL